MSETSCDQEAATSSDQGAAFSVDVVNDPSWSLSGFSNFVMKFVTAVVNNNHSCSVTGFSIWLQFYFGTSSRVILVPARTINRSFVSNWRLSETDTSIACPTMVALDRLDAHNLQLWDNLKECMLWGGRSLLDIPRFSLIQKKTIISK